MPIKKSDLTVGGYHSAKIDRISGSGNGIIKFADGDHANLGEVGEDMAGEVVTFKYLGRGKVRYYGGEDSENTSIDEGDYGTAVPVLYWSDDSEKFQYDHVDDRSSDYEPVAWAKTGEKRLYIDKSLIDVQTQNGMPEELLEPRRLSSNSSEADLKRELIEFFRDVEEEITFTELDEFIESRGYDPSGTYTYSEAGSAAIFWKADETYINAISNLIDNNKIYMYNPRYPNEKASRYLNQASDLDRSIPVSHLPVAKRPGEYSYKTPHWIPVYFKSGLI